jgi:hypothetical protein
MNVAVSTMGRSRHARGLLVLLCFIGAIWMLSAWIMDASSQMLVIGGMGIALLIILVSTLNDWRVGLYLFIGWLLFEDLARKYMGNSTMLFFGKDILAAITICSLLLAKQRRRIPWFRPRFLAPLALFFGLALIQVFNTGSPSLLYGLLGLKLYFFYIPLMYAGYALLQTSQDLERFLVYNIALGLVIAGLGIAQSILGLGFLNPSQLAPDLAELSSLSRESPLTHQWLAAPTSVFVSAGRFDYYVIFVVILALGAQAYLLLTRRRRAAWGFLGVGVAVVAAMQSGSRSSFLWGAMSILILSAGFLWGAPWRWGQGHRLMKAFRRAALVSAIGLFLMVMLFPEKIGATWAFYSETLSPTSSAGELGYRAVDYPLGNLEYAFQRERWPIGYGTGTASLGTQYVAQLLGQQSPGIWIENGWGVLLLEMGILGPVLWWIWTGTLLIAAWRIVRQLRQTLYFPVAFAFFWYIFLLLVPFSYLGMSPYQNYVLNAYCWILVGMLWRLPHLARSPQTVPVQAVARQLAGSPAYLGAR